MYTVYVVYRLPYYLAISTKALPTTDMLKLGSAFVSEISPVILSKLVLLMYTLCEVAQVFSDSLKHK